MVTDLSPAQRKLIRNVTGWRFHLFLISQLPMGWIAGLRVRSLTPVNCTTSVPFHWWNKNPFRSMYFAVQAMAAELSTASPCLLAITGQKPSVAFIIVDCKAYFLKKATDKITFSCADGAKAFEAVEKCRATGEAVTTSFHTTGTMKDGTVVAEFEFTWSFKQRRS